jgi:hypothetical protein
MYSNSKDQKALEESYLKIHNEEVEEEIDEIEDEEDTDSEEESEDSEEETKESDQ